MPTGIFGAALEGGAFCPGPRYIVSKIDLQDAICGRF